MIDKSIDRSKLSPMMQHYVQVREEYPDCIIFYRLGDFYEMFFDNAELVSRELEITLTGRECGLDERAPMCGVPFHSASSYIARLIEKGYKVAICEQVEDAKLAKGMVNREVVRVVTPGTVVDPELLDERKNNYLCIAYKSGDGIGIAFSDISTGELYVTQTADDMSVINEVARYMPAEIIMNEAAAVSVADDINLRLKIEVQEFTEEFFEFEATEEYIYDHFGRNVKQFDIEMKTAAQIAVCGILRYFEHTQKSGLQYLNNVSYYNISEFMELDAATRRNLEITETMRDKVKRGSLLWAIDNTKTSMGARLLKQWLEKPLLNRDSINRRLEAVRELVENVLMRDEFAETLGGVYDIARITSRISLGSVGPRELVALKTSLEKMPDIKRMICGLKSQLFRELEYDFDLCEDMKLFLDRAIEDEETPAMIKDGGVIKDGFSETLDMYRKAEKEGKGWLAGVEAEEREKTGIKNIKVKYNKVFGYYIEISKSNLSLVPDYYIRKQTLTNAERFITPKLKELEGTILGAAEKGLALEAQLYEDIVNRLRDGIDRLKRICYVISVSDVICSLAETAYKNNYVMPEITEDGVLEIKDGRHPVVEKMQKRSVFVPNDTKMNKNDDRVIIITGPNMAGKSTYMRQVAVIALLAQIGSFVPASSARVGVCDKIFTRVGASDDIASGQSTFMVEMTEVASILKNATENSLIILDEIGRGTSTFDGLSIAWSVVEYVQNRKILGAKTLFATHYHELTQLEDKLDGVKNYNIAVKKRGDDITFLRKIVRGGTDDSYGIEVAALAGVPEAVIKRAKKVLEAVESGDTAAVVKKDKKEEAEIPQMSFAETMAVSLAHELRDLDATTFTPIEAMNKLYELSMRAKDLF